MYYELTKKDQWRWNISVDVATRLSTWLTIVLFYRTHSEHSSAKQSTGEWNGGRSVERWTKNQCCDWNRVGWSVLTTSSGQLTQPCLN